MTPGTISQLNLRNGFKSEEVLCSVHSLADTPQQYYTQ